MNANKAIAQTREAIEGLVGQISAGVDLPPVLKPIYANVLSALESHGKGREDIARIVSQVRQLFNIEPPPKKEPSQLCEQTEANTSPSNVSPSTQAASESVLPTSHKGKSK